MAKNLPKAQGGTGSLIQKAINPIINFFKPVTPTVYPSFKLGVRTVKGFPYDANYKSPYRNYDDWMNYVKSTQPIPDFATTPYQLPSILKGDMNFLVNKDGMMNTSQLGQFINKTKGVNPGQLYDRSIMKTAFDNLNLGDQKKVSFTDFNNEVGTLLNVNPLFGTSVGTSPMKTNTKWRAYWQGDFSPFEKSKTNINPLSSDQATVLNSYFDPLRYSSLNMQNYLPLLDTYKVAGNKHYNPLGITGGINIMGKNNEPFTVAHQRIVLDDTRDGGFSDGILVLERQSDQAQEFNKNARKTYENNQIFLNEPSNVPNRETYFSQAHLDQQQKFKNLTTADLQTRLDAIKTSGFADDSYNWATDDVNTMISQYAYLVDDYGRLQNNIKKNEGQTIQEYLSSRNEQWSPSFDKMYHQVDAESGVTKGGSYDRNWQNNGAQSHLLNPKDRVRYTSFMAQDDFWNQFDYKKHSDLLKRNYDEGGIHNLSAEDKAEILASPGFKKYLEHKNAYAQQNYDDAKIIYDIRKNDALEFNNAYDNFQNNPDEFQSALKKRFSNSTAVQLGELVDYAQKVGKEYIYLPLPKTVIQTQGYTADEYGTPNSGFNEYRWSGHSGNEFIEQVDKAYSNEAVRDFGDGYGIKLNYGEVPYFDANGEKVYPSGYKIIAGANGKHKLIKETDIPQYQQGIISIGNDVDGTNFDNYEILDLEQGVYSELSFPDKQTYRKALVDEAYNWRTQFLKEKGHDPAASIGGNLRKEHQAIVNKYTEKVHAKDIKNVLGPNATYEIVNDPSGLPYVRVKVPGPDDYRLPIKGKDVYNYGGQTKGYALDDNPDPLKYKVGGQTYDIKQYQNGNEVPSFDDEYDNFRTFIQQEETSWDYVKNKNSAVLKPDGKTYYKIYENGMFYPYYHQNADGSYENQATIGFGRKGPNIYNDYKDGVGLEQAEKWKDEDIDNALRKTKIYIDANYGDTAYDNLPDRTKFMLADFTYNLGRLSLYPKFADAIMTNNFDKALEEYIRNDNKKGAPLGRNKRYLDVYLQPWIDNTKLKLQREEEERIQKERDAIMNEKYSSWYSPFVPNSIENLFKQNYDWEDQYFKDKGITTYDEGGSTNDPYEKYGGLDNYTKMLNFLRYQEALKPGGNKDMANFYNDLYGFGDMSFGDAYGQARDIFETYQNNPNDPIAQEMLGRMINEQGQPQFEWQGNQYNPYSYTEIPSDKMINFQKDLVNRLSVIYNNPDKQNTGFVRTVDPITGESTYSPNIESYIKNPSDILFQKPGDLEKFIYEQFPEGSQDRAYLDANPTAFEQMIADYEERLPHIMHANTADIFGDRIYDEENNKYVSSLTNPERHQEVIDNWCAKMKKEKGDYFNCETGRVEYPGQTFLSQDNRTDKEREDARLKMERFKLMQKNMIPPNFMFMVNASPGLQSMYQEALRTNDFSKVNEQFINFSPSNPVNLALGAGVMTGAYALPKALNFLNTPLAKYAPRIFNPNAARAFTVGDAVNVGFGAYGTGKYGPSMISNIGQGEYRDAASDFGNLALYNIGTPGSLIKLNRGLNFGKVYPGQFSKSILPQRNITPSTLDAFKIKYPNLNPTLSPQQYESFAGSFQQLPNYSLLNPLRIKFPNTQSLIGQPIPTQSGFGNIFQNLNQGATLVPKLK